MRTETLIKLIIVAVVVLILYKKGLPWLKGHQAASSKASVTAANDKDCAGAAAAASETWGSGVSRFNSASPDVAEWTNFRSSVDNEISSALKECGGYCESCNKGREAMQQLRSLISDFDGAIRTGNALPGDVVQKQEIIDNLIDAARELQRQGK
jgi:hypothetical protein